jgi:hypothetical protein
MINTPNRQAVTRLAPGNICAEAHVDVGLYQVQEVVCRNTTEETVHGKLVTGTGQAETAMHRISVQLHIMSSDKMRNSPKS